MNCPCFVRELMLVGSNLAQKLDSVMEFSYGFTWLELGQVVGSVPLRTRRSQVQFLPGAPNLSKAYEGKRPFRWLRRTRPNRVRSSDGTSLSRDLTSSALLVGTPITLFFLSAAPVIGDISAAFPVFILPSLHINGVASSPVAHHKWEGPDRILLKLVFQLIYTRSAAAIDPNAQISQPPRVWQLKDFEWNALIANLDKSLIPILGKGITTVWFQLMRSR